MCLVSVIISNYNYGKFLKQSIDSVLQQSYSDFEIIIVDDGSQDDSRSIINKYSDSRLTPVFKGNGGQASAFNIGFEQAKGKIVAFLDSDDWWKPNKLETIVKWHALLHGQYSVLQHGLDVWHQGQTFPYKNILPVGDCFSEMQRTGNIDYFVPTSGLVFSKETLCRIFPLPLSLKICADAYIMRTAFIYGPVISIPQSLGFYRKHSNSVFGNSEFDFQKFS